jgi:uncharacterized Zn finger protein
MRWGKYVPVAKRRASASQKMDKLRKQGKDIQPVAIDGRTIARSFWGKGWCDHLESFSDYANRLPRGRSYVRNGSVCHLDIQPGRIEAKVSGSRLYDVAITIRKLDSARWKTIRDQCAGHIGSLLELLQGKLSDQVMTIVSDRRQGLFPQPGEIAFSCSCPDWADMCKHVAAVLYGVGNRLDQRPELLFLLRDVDAEQLIGSDMTLPQVTAGSADDAIAGDQLGDIFGIDFDSGSGPEPASQTPAKTTRKKKAAVQAKPKNTPEKPKRPEKKQASMPLPEIRPTGKSIARLRQQQGLSVARFAARLGVAEASVYRWEATPGPLTLQAKSLQALAALQPRTQKTRKTRKTKK